MVHNLELLQIKDLGKFMQHLKVLEDRHWRLGSYCLRFSFICFVLLLLSILTSAKTGIQ